jgi:hypothetical protein
MEETSEYRSTINKLEVRHFSFFASQPRQKACFFLFLLYSISAQKCLGKTCIYGCKIVSVAQCSLRLCVFVRKKSWKNYYTQFLHMHTCECTLGISSQNTLIMSFGIFRNNYLLHFKFGFVSCQQINQHKCNPFSCLNNFYEVPKSPNIILNVYLLRQYTRIKKKRNILCICYRIVCFQQRSTNEVRKGLRTKLICLPCC